MTLREKLAAIFAIPCHAWHDEPTIANNYLKIISKFGMEKNLCSWAEEYIRYHTGRCLWDSEFLISNFSFTNCLNVGGAPFIFEYLVKKKRVDINIMSIDINRQRFPFVEDVLGIEVIEANIESPDQQQFNQIGQFDCIVFCEIFEHLRIDLLGTISFLKTLLTKEGCLYLTMPNGIGISALRRWMRGRTGPDPVSEWMKLRNLGHMGHVREYSYFEVHDILSHCGFHIDKYMYRRNTRNLTDRILTRAIPILADELVIVARHTVSP